MTVVDPNESEYAYWRENEGFYAPTNLDIVIAAKRKETNRFVGNNDRKVRYPFKPPVFGPDNDCQVRKTFGRDIRSRIRFSAIDR
ncbi:hypothetical protein [Paenibacillus sp. GYB003]|uniref:hypothetical protein n=1 Tax=Paenibacillus sp. GYB003 TaxID=2994392 RepID=UPI002F967456